MKTIFSIALVQAVTLMTFGLAPKAAEAGTINFVDLTNTVTANSPDYTLIKQADSIGELLHITFMSADASPVSGTFSKDLIEPAGATSDRMLLTIVAGSNLIDVKFGSVPDLPPNGLTIRSPITEDGTNQLVFTSFKTNGAVSDQFFAQSDFVVPEPSTLMMASLAVVFVLGCTWRHRKRVVA